MKKDKKLCEMCGEVIDREKEEEELIPQDQSENPNRCATCYREWGDGWADQ
jgi:uncharacterized protein with PIN domain